VKAARNIRLLYGREGMELTVPATATILAGRHAPGLPQPARALRDALRNPIGSPPLAELLRRRRPRSVAVTLSDITRPVPNAEILHAVLETLNAEGVSDDQVTLLIGTGMHRPSTPTERLELLGEDLLRRCRVVDHRADDAGSLVRVADDPPVSVNALFARADFRIVTGLIEPHFMAGFSGGRKGVCPALVDLQTVQRFHGYSLLSDARSTAGRLDGNPCHAESLRIARLVGVDFLVNVAVNADRRMCGVYAGDMEQAHLTGARDVAAWTSARVDEPYDLVVTCGGGYPLDQTFYQTVKGMVAALPACREDSLLLLASDCGGGIGSESYAELMFAHADWRAFLDKIAADPRVRKDQWQAQMHCRMLEKLGVERIRLACDGLSPDVLAKLWVTPLRGPGPAGQRCQRAIDEFLAARPNARVAVIPDGPYTFLKAGTRD